MYHPFYEDIVVVIEHQSLTREISGDNVLVSLGRIPSSSGFGLENIEIKTDGRGFVLTGKKLRTNIKNIYACGDITGPYQFTHMAGYQG